MISADFERLTEHVIGRSLKTQSVTLGRDAALRRPRASIRRRFFRSNLVTFLTFLTLLQYLLIERSGLPGNRRPTEFRFRAFSSGLFKLRA